jgi:hypothetical protein
MIFAARRYGANEVYYYKEGNEYTSRTGGWVEGYSSGNNPDAQTGVFKESDSLLVYAGGTTSTSTHLIRTFVTEEPVDLTNISAIIASMSIDHISGSKGQLCGIAVISTQNENPNGSSIGFTRDSDYTGDLSLDVSGLSGSYHIAIYARAGQNTKISGRVYQFYGVRDA